MEEPLFKPGDSFNSWEEVNIILQRETEQTNAVFSVHNSKLVSGVNPSLKSSIKYKDELVYTNALISCKHYGEVRSRSTGIRPNQSTIKIGCPWFIHIIADRKLQKLSIKKLKMEHNHTLDKDVTDFYPENRGLDDQETMNVEKLLKLRVKPSILLDLIRKETGKKVTGQDLTNLRYAKELKDRNGLSETDHLLEYLNTIEAEGDHVVVGTNEDNVIQYIFIVHSGMDDVFKKFPEVIIMDSTYNTSKNKFPLLILCVMNGMGITEAVGYSFVLNETANMISEVLEQFKTIVSEDSFSEIKTVVLDKDPGEIAAIQRVIPDAYIQLCIFHVLQVFNRETKGQLNKNQIREILQKMVYAQFDEEYNNLYNSLACIASEEFMKYFDENWDKCPQAWTRKSKLESPNLGNDTSNRAESINQKIKLIVDRSGSIKSAIEDLKLPYLHAYKPHTIISRTPIFEAKTEEKSFVYDCKPH